MLTIFDSFRTISFASVALRLFLTFLCGGFIGAEREIKRRQAGFRTHILICLGAAMTTLTSQYLSLFMGYTTDLGRLGAQVVSGIGFIGAGAIVVTKRRRVKGLTTAAGLWVSSIIGLCFGAGFYEGGIVATVLVIFAETWLYRFEYRILRYVPEIYLQAEYVQSATLDALLSLFKSLHVKVLHMEITRQSDQESNPSVVIFNLRLNKKCPIHELLEFVQALDGICSVQEL